MVSLASENDTEGRSRTIPKKDWIRPGLPRAEARRERPDTICRAFLPQLFLHSRVGEPTPAYARCRVRRTARALSLRRLGRGSRRTWRRQKILVVGSGGREHALAVRLLASESRVGGRRGAGQRRHDSERGATAGRRFATPSGDPLRRRAARSAGPGRRRTRRRRSATVSSIVCAAEGILAFGPSRAAAQLEGSKAFMKDFVRRQGILTARHETLRDAATAERVIRTLREAAGRESGRALCRQGRRRRRARTTRHCPRPRCAMLSGESFGDAGRTVVVEERIVGARGQRARHHRRRARAPACPSAQDHKRIGDGDRARTPAAWARTRPRRSSRNALAERIRRDIFESHGARHGGRRQCRIAACCSRG